MLELLYPVVGLLPGLLWLAFFYFKARKPRTFGNILRVFAWGCACTVPTGVLEHITGAELAQETIYGSAAVSFFLIGPFEEFFKLAAVWVGMYRRDDFREPIDGIVYAATAAMAFASMENFVYVAYLGPGILLSRAVFATPAHLMFSAMWGYSMGLARFRRRGELSTICKGLAIAALLHGVYNFLVAFHPKTAMMSLVPLMAFMAWLVSLRVKEFRKSYPFEPISDGCLIACPSCGAYTPEEEDACMRCGTALPLIETDAPRYCGHCRAVLEPCRDSCARCGRPVSLSRLCPPGE